MKTKFEQIKKTSSNILSTLNKIDKLKVVERDFEKNSKKRRDNARNDINYLFIDLEMLKHELHCLCVEAFICSRENERYGEKIFKPDGWHELKKNMREPKI